jgi:transposase
MKLRTKEAQEFRLHQILSLSEEGYTQPDIARLLECTQSWVSKLLKRAQLEGKHKLKAKGYAPGKTPALSKAELNQLRACLEAEAQAAGFASDGWTRQRVAQLIFERFAVGHDLSHISTILGKLGFSLQKPRRRDYRQDDEAVAQWRQQTLPKLKKSAP